MPNYTEIGQEMSKMRT